MAVFLFMPVTSTQCAVRSDAIGKYSARSDDSLIQMKHRTRAVVQTDMTRTTEGGFNVMKKSLLAMLCVAAAGCSTQGQVDPDVMQIATTPLTCSNKTECDVWWQRAQAWVASQDRKSVV